MRDRKRKIWFLLSNQTLIGCWTVEKPEPSVVVIYMGLFGLTRTPSPLSKVSRCQILFRCKQKLNWVSFTIDELQISLETTVWILQNEK